MKPTVQPKSNQPQPTPPTRLQRWLLGATIAMEALWVILLLAMKLASS
jgi:hypothetical protein